MLYETIIVGGSYAGMAAALQLARARRRVLVLDAGQRRNRFASHSHGFLTQDGEPPDVIAGRAREQLMRYPTVTWREGAAVAAAATENGFLVRMKDGGQHEGRRLVLATGVVDELPDLPGLQERWGTSVFLCPYCDGYELERGRLGVLATGPLWFHQAMLIPEWGPTTLFTSDLYQPDTEQRTALAARGVTVEEGPVAAVEGERATMRMVDGRGIPLDGLFLIPRIRFAAPLASVLGCALEDGPAGPFISTDARKETSVPGVFACGDVARGLPRPYPWPWGTAP